MRTTDTEDRTRAQLPGELQAVQSWIWSTIRQRSANRGINQEFGAVTKDVTSTLDFEREL